MIDNYNLSYQSNFYQRFKTVNSLPSFPKNIEVRPGDIEPIIIRQEGLTLAWIMKWGLIPFWAKERGVSRHMFNVSAESLTTKLGFRNSFKTKRCLIPANNNNHIDIQQYFAFAGVYDLWVEPVSGHEIYTYAIIVTGKDHTPVILKPSDEPIWLNEITPVSNLKTIIRF